MGKLSKQNKIEPSNSVQPRLKVDKQDNMDVIHIIMTFTWFACNLYIFSEFPHLDLSILGLFKLIFVCIGISFFIPIKFYRKKLTMSFYEYLFINLLALGPLFTVCSFYMNETFGSVPYTEKHLIVDSRQTNNGTLFELENHAYQDKVYLRKVNASYRVNKKDSLYLNIQLIDGLLGFRVIEGIYLEK